MKKLKSIVTGILIVILAMACVTAVSACGDDESGGSGNNPPPVEPPDKQEITGITFTGETVDYDSHKHMIYIAGNVPQGVSVAYTVNGQPFDGATDAGSYIVKATLSGTDYNTKELTATLTINKIEMTGITFAGETVDYDSRKHMIYIVGNVPQGVSVVYTVNGQPFDGATDAGSYTVKATLSGTNYITKELTATLKIVTEEKMLYSTVYGGTTYFQNALDDDKLYCYQGGTVEKVNNDVPKYFTSDGTNLYYYSSGLFMSTIKQLNATNTTKLYSVNADYLTSDGTYIYYAVNNLINAGDKNGIYRLSIADCDTEEPTRITTDKADYLTCYGGKIYFSNKSEGGKLYSVPTTAVESKGTALSENKITALIQDNGVLYYTDHTLTGSAIYKYTISDGATTKLTTDNGAYLTKVGDYVYYVNKDLLTSNIFGKGIYRVSVHGGAGSEKVLESTDGNAYFSLASDGNNLYYYKLNDRHFYRYAISTQAETDLMANFTVTDETTLSGYSFLGEHDGEIFYTSLRDNCLYKYNPTSGAKYKVISDSVSNVYFNGEYMYYSTYVLTNYALWRYDLNTGVSQKINAHRFEQIIFTDECLYAIKVQSSPAKSILVKMDLDGQNYTELFTDTGMHATTLRLIGDKLYFCTNPAVGYKKIHYYDITVGTDTSTDLGVKSDKFTSIGNTVYYFEHTADKLCSVNADGTGNTELLSVSELKEIYEVGGKIYFTGKYNGVVGLYCFSPASNTCSLITSGYTAGLAFSDGKLYYVKATINIVNDYPVVNADSDGNLYCYDLADGREVKLTKS